MNKKTFLAIVSNIVKCYSYYVQNVVKVNLKACDTFDQGSIPGSGPHVDDTLFF
jgi:hypothetical protein